MKLLKIKKYHDGCLRVTYYIWFQRTNTYGAESFVVKKNILQDLSYNVQVGRYSHIFTVTAKMKKKKIPAQYIISLARKADFRNILPVVVRLCKKAPKNPFLNHIIANSEPNIIERIHTKYLNQH